MDESTRQTLKQYALDALDILKHCIDMYDSGSHHFYRVAAVQLRLLLCDTTFRHDRQEDIALMPRLTPDLRLYSLNGNPGSLLDLQTWLDSPMKPPPSLSIRQLIRRVCDIDGGAHVDIKPLAGLPKDEDIGQWIIDISSYLLPVLSEALRR